MDSAKSHFEDAAEFFKRYNDCKIYDRIMTPLLQFIDTLKSI